MSEWVRVAAADEIPDGGCRRVEVNGERVALVRVNGQFHAIHDTCVHRGGSLSEGNLIGTLLTCPWHFWQFDVTTGACDSADDIAVRRYEVKVEDGAVLIAS